MAHRLRDVSGYIVARAILASLGTILAVVGLPLFLVAIASVFFAFVTFGYGIPLIPAGVYAVLQMTSLVVWAHLPIYLVVLPLLTLVGPRHGLIRSACLLLAGGTCGWLLPPENSSSDRTAEILSAFAGFLAAGAYSHFVRGIWPSMASEPVSAPSHPSPGH